MGTESMRYEVLPAGLLLKRYRRRAGLDQDGLARRASLTPSYISKLECGRRPLPLATLEQLADVLDLSMPERVGWRRVANHASPTLERLLGDVTPMDRSGIPSVSQVYGREEELDAIERWMSEEGCRAVVLLGIGGQGKTALAARAADRICHSFDCVVWLSLAQAPPVLATLRACLQKLLESGSSPLPEAEDAQFALLTAHLQAHRCLLVFDNLEAVLAGGWPAGGFLADCDGYNRLIRSCCTPEVTSRLLMTTRDLPEDWNRLERGHHAIRVLRVGGVGRDAGRDILRDQGLQEEPEALDTLITRCEGHPLALRLMAGVIRDLFDGQSERFHEVGSSVQGQLRAMLDQQFARLSQAEQQLLYWLAIERVPVRPEMLRGDLNSCPSVAPSLRMPRFATSPRPRRSPTGRCGLSAPGHTRIPHRSARRRRSRRVADPVVGPSRQPRVAQGSGR